MTISLIGYRGTGKSRVAPLLAQRLGWAWIDADVELEQRVGRTIQEIFATDGEAEFRRLERGLLQELLQQPQLVLATGGGAILNADTRADLRAAGPVVWLTAAPLTIARRIGGDRRSATQRPRLTKLSPTQEILHVLAAREPLYRECATLTIATDRRRPKGIADEILETLALEDSHE